MNTQSSENNRHAELGSASILSFIKCFYFTQWTLNQVQGDASLFIPPTLCGHDGKEKGFTLIELAIALMVIGLLIGGVLKGQELIENAKVTATMRNINAYDTATMIFRSTYGALPSDIRQPARIPNCTETPCSSPGNGNGQIGDHLLENYNFWPHLSKAGLIQGPQGSAVLSEVEHFFPIAPYKDLDFRLTYIDGKHLYTLSGEAYYPGGGDQKIPRILDQKADDGNARKGKIGAWTSEYGYCFSPDTGEYLDNGWCEMYAESTF